MEKTDVLKNGVVLYGCYEIKECICRTRFSAVYKAYDKYLNKECAVKEYFPGSWCLRDKDGCTIAPYLGAPGTLYAEGLENFINDSKDIMKIKDCDNIVKVFNLFEENNTAYCVMEYVHGTTLAVHLQKETYTYPKAMEIMRPVMRALKVLHAAGLVHRNVSPDNIIISSDNKPVLTDYGSYHYVASDSEESMTTISRDPYSPMEQYMKKGTQGPYTDVYSCAAVLYRMIMGTEVMFAVSSGGTAYLKRPDKYAKGIDQDSSAAIINALHSNYKERTGTIDDFMAELDGTVSVSARYDKTQGADIFKRDFRAMGVVIICVIAVAVMAAVTISDIAGRAGKENRKYILESGMTIVPNVINQQIDDALEITRRSFLYMLISDKEYSPDVEKGAVLSQGSTPGDKVEAGDYLEVVYCAGVRQIYAESVIGMSREEAGKLLEEIGFKVNYKEVNSMVMPGYVATQSISAGEAADDGSIIVLGISKGREDINENVMTTIPQLVGVTLEEAEKLCEDAKVYYMISKRVNYDDNPGKIYSQSPEGGLKLPEGTIIELVYNDGPEMIRVPDYQYKNISDVQTITGNLDLEIEYMYENSTTVAENRVIRQSAAAGTLVSKGTHITLWISLGVPDVNIDDIVQKTTASLTTAAAHNSTTRPGTSSAPESSKNTKENNTSAATSQSQTTTPATEQTTPIQYEDDTAPQKWEYDYTVENGTVTIKSIKLRKYWNTVFDTEEITIPSRIDGYDVTAIEGLATNAQYGDAIKTVNIPDTVKTINISALKGRTSLQKIVVDSKNTVYSSYGGALYNKDKTVIYLAPAAIRELKLAPELKEITNDAITSCQYISQITIPAATTNIPNVNGGVFGGCNNLKNIYVESGNIRFFSYNGVLYENGYMNWGDGIDFFNPDTWEYNTRTCKLLEIPYTQTSITVKANCNLINAHSCPYNSLKQISIESGNSDLTVYDDVVYNKRNGKWSIEYFPQGKTEVTLMDGLTELSGELYTSTSLQKLVIPESVTQIGKSQLWNVTNLSSVNIPAGVTSIGDGVLKKSTGVTVTVVKGTYGEQWCKDNNIEYIYS